MHADTPGTVIPRTNRHRRSGLVGLIAVVALVAAACGSGSSPSTSTAASTTALIKPPDLVLAGCNYEIHGQVPAGMDQGVQPPFTSSAPNQAAVSALEDIRDHGGSALVDGFMLPPGVELYGGPDASTAPVATIPQDGSVVIAEPVLWTTSSGQKWLATFVACGGHDLYWIDVSQISKANADSGTAITNSIALAERSTYSPTTLSVGVAPITIGADHRFAWKSGELTFPIGRGEYQGF